MTTTDVNDFLLGGGVASAKFPTIGARVKGTIVSSEVTQQTDLATGKPKFWDAQETQPMMQAVITLQTEERDPEIEDDQGLRKLYVKGQMQKALSEALRKAGAKLEVGGTLAVKYESDGKASKAGYTPPKQYVAAYQAPVGGVNDLLGADTPADSASSVQTQQPAGVAPDDLLG